MGVQRETKRSIDCFEKHHLMVVVGIVFPIFFAYCGLVVEIQPLNC